MIRIDTHIAVRSDKDAILSIRRIGDIETVKGGGIDPIELPGAGDGILEIHTRAPAVLGSPFFSEISTLP